MATDIATLGMELDTTGLSQGRRELRGFQSDADKAAASADKTERSFKRMGETAGLLRNAIASIGIIASVRKIIGETVTAQDSLMRLEVISRNVGKSLQFTTGELEEMASQLQRNTRFSDDAALSAQGMFAAMNLGGRDVLPRLLDLSADMATFMGTDLQQAAGTMAKALKDPEQGLMLLNRQLRLFTDDETKALKSMADAGRGAEVQKIVMERLERTYGGLAKTARDNLGGAMAGLSNQFGDLLEGKNGNGGVGAVTEGINQLTDTLARPEVQEGFQTFVSGVLLGLTKIVETITMITDGIVRISAWAAERVGGKAFGTSGEVQVEIDRKNEYLRREMATRGNRWQQERITKLKEEIALLEQHRRLLFDLEVARNRAGGKPDGKSGGTDTGGSGGIVNLTAQQEEAARIQKENDEWSRGVVEGELARIGAETEARNSLLQTYDEEGSALRQLEDDLRRLNETRHLMTSEEWTAAQLGIADRFRQIGIEAKDSGQKVQDAYGFSTISLLQSAVDTGGAAIKGVFESIWKGTFKVKDAFKSIASAFSDMIADMISKSLAYWAIQQIVGLASGGSYQVVGGMIQETPRATGGEMYAGRPYMTGERGPELVVPTTPSYVVPNHKLGMMGGQSITVHAPTQIDARGSSLEMLPVLARMQREGEERTKAAVFEAIRRGINP
jgi:hypothetical protein